MVALGLLVVQVVLGAITVRLELPPMIVLAHLATAMALLAAVCVTAVAASVARPTTPTDRASVPLARAAAAGTYLLILSGSLVVGSGASSSCAAWPLCGGGFSLSFEGYPAIQLVHRGLAAAIGVLIIVSLFALLNRHRVQRAVRATVALTLAALAFQVAVGAAVVTLHLPAAWRGPGRRGRRRHQLLDRPRPRRSYAPHATPPAARRPDRAQPRLALRHRARPGRLRAPGFLGQRADRDTGDQRPALLRLRLHA